MSPKLTRGVLDSRLALSLGHRHCWWQHTIKGDPQVWRSQTLIGQILETTVCCILTTPLTQVEPGDVSAEVGTGGERVEAPVRELYCICKQPDDGRDLVCCDVCEGWFHPECMDRTLEVYSSKTCVFCFSPAPYELLHMWLQCLSPFTFTVLDLGSFRPVLSSWESRTRQAVNMSSWWTAVVNSMRHKWDTSHTS